LTQTPGHLGLHGLLVLGVVGQKEFRHGGEFVSHHKDVMGLLMLGECAHLVSVQNHHDHCGMSSVPDIIMCHIKERITSGLECPEKILHVVYIVGLRAIQTLSIDLKPRLRMGQNVMGETH